MMTATAPFFSDPGVQLALEAELMSWRGTRFWPKSGGSARKGVGADCVSFVEAVLVNVGAIHPIEWPQYVICGGGVPMREMLLRTLDNIPEFGRIWWPETAVDWLSVELMPGDVLVRSVKDDSHHIAIYGGGRDKKIWHSLKRYGVCTASVGDTFGAQDMQVIFRAYASH